MPDIELNVTGLNEGAAWWDYMAANIDPILQEQLHILLVRVVNQAKSNVQQNISVVTGNLLGSIKIIEEGDLQGTVGTTEWYAVYVEYGRGVIYPVKAKVLHWVSKDGKDVFAMKAGEAPPRPFLEPAVFTESADFAEKVIEALNVWANTVL